ncbi:MAG: hypothetical protein NC489_45010 [Ruminococcus flavefaciens]|nr:hypothetical protein [Ruminococcus flavefaciens]
MKKAIILFVMLMSMVGLSACATDKLNTSDISTPDRPEKMYEDVAVEDFRQVNISGNASSIVIRRSESKNFEFYNGDLNPAHTYTVRCDKNGEILNIEVTIENPENDNDVLGSPMIDIPEKEFEIIEIAGNFGQVSLHTINSDVLIHANNSLVNLDLEADRLNHNITLDGSELDIFRKVSVYFDKFPDNVRMDLNLIQGGAINDPQDILKKKGFESGSRKPVISVNYAQEISIYSEE